MDEETKEKNDKIQKNSKNIVKVIHPNTAITRINNDIVEQSDLVKIIKDPSRGLGEMFDALLAEEAGNIVRLNIEREKAEQGGKDIVPIITKSAKVVKDLGSMMISKREIQLKEYVSLRSEWAQSVLWELIKSFQNVIDDSSLKDEQKLELLKSIDMEMVGWEERTEEKLLKDRLTKENEYVEKADKLSSLSAKEIEFEEEDEDDDNDEKAPKKRNNIN